MMSLMCTSCASKPARSNAAAISTSPFTPCSRRIAIGGRAPRAMNGAATFSGGIERQHGRDAGVVSVEDAVVLLRAPTRGCRAATACSHVVSLHARCSATRVSLNTMSAPCRTRHACRLSRRPADDPRREAVRAQRAEHGARRPLSRTWIDGAQFLGKQAGQQIRPPLAPAIASASSVDADVAGKRHLEDRDDQAAVRPVVVREHQAGARAALASAANRPRIACGVVHVGRLVAGLTEHLREHGPAQPRFGRPPDR